jgi:hypothetical protein
VLVIARLLTPPTDGGGDTCAGVCDEIQSPLYASICTGLCDVVGFAAFALLLKQCVPFCCDVRVDKARVKVGSARDLPVHRIAFVHTKQLHKQMRHNDVRQCNTTHGSDW